MFDGAAMAITRVKILTARFADRLRLRSAAYSTVDTDAKPSSPQAIVDLCDSTNVSSNGSGVRWS
jgi:hypothetical protein